MACRLHDNPNPRNGPHQRCFKAVESYVGHDEFDELAISLWRILKPETPFTVSHHKGLPHHTMRLFEGNTTFIHHHALKRVLAPSCHGGQHCENNHDRA